MILKTKVVIMIAMIMSVFLYSPVFAADLSDSAQVNASATILPRALNLTETSAISFGNIQVGSTGGTVTVPQISGDPVTFDGDVDYEVGSGEIAGFVASGEPGYTFTISFADASINLSGPGDDMLVDNFLISAGTLASLEADGTQAFNVGATLHVNGNQVAGAYTGTYTVNIEYQ